MPKRSDSTFVGNDVPSTHRQPALHGVCVCEREGGGGNVDTGGTPAHRRVRAVPFSFYRFDVRVYRFIQFGPTSILPPLYSLSLCGGNIAFDAFLLARAGNFYPCIVWMDG